MAKTNYYENDRADFMVAMNKILDSYSREVQAAAQLAFNQIAKEAVQRLKQTSPVGRGKNAGEYAKSWTLKKTERKQRQGIETIVVYNKDHYQLTHLLEYGHALPQGGRANAQPHIAPVNDWAANEVVRRIEGNL